mgnify:CR=1 FL=1
MPPGGVDDDDTDEEANLVASARALSPRPCESFRMFGSHFLCDKRRGGSWKMHYREEKRNPHPPKPPFFLEAARLAAELPPFLSLPLSESTTERKVSTRFNTNRVTGRVSR